MSKGHESKCLKCRQPLTSDGGYCLSCGFNNTDTVLRKHQLIQRADRRIEFLRGLRKVFRFIFWSRFFR